MGRICQKGSSRKTRELIHRPVSLIPLTLILILLFHRKRLKKLETVSLRSKRNSGEKGLEEYRGWDLQSVLCSLHTYLSASFYFSLGLNYSSYQVGGWTPSPIRLRSWCLDTMVESGKDHRSFPPFPATLRGSPRCP